MDSSDVALSVSKLRRELEDILAIVKAGPANGLGAPAEACQASSPDQPDAKSETIHTEVSGVDQSRDDLYDDALVVVTEFGQATPSILQMWLSIDYSRAARILSRFEAEGLISSKGKLRHKAYAMRRSSYQL
jgi:DNA segregation ATPase FtsK/SpoIIIE-like protein